MAPDDEPLPLDYTPRWIALGIVTDADIRRDAHSAATGDDPNPEHYRWRAFSRFLDAQQTLAPSLARELYALGKADADFTMGGSMMGAILRRADCPSDLLHSALESEQAHLRRIAVRRLNPDAQGA
jgi:hypothetical protein